MFIVEERENVDGGSASMTVDIRAVWWSSGNPNTPWIRLNVVSIEANWIFDANGAESTDAVTKERQRR